MRTTYEINTLSQKTYDMHTILANLIHPRLWVLINSTSALKALILEQKSNIKQSHKLTKLQDQQTASHKVSDSSSHSKINAA